METNSQAPSVVPLEISVQEAQRQIAEGGVHLRLIDVRDNEEFAFNRLPGAQHIPLDLLPREAPAKLMRKDGDILVYCHHGMRSMNAVQHLRSLGYAKARSITGGIDKWSTEIDDSVPRY